MTHDFFGHRINERVGSVIVAAEGYSTLNNRIAAAKRHLGISRNLPIAYWSFSGDLRQATDRQSLINLLNLIANKFHTLHGVRLGVVIIDVLAAAFGMTEENSNAEAAAILRILREIGNATGAVIIPVHHYGKNHESGLRGASAFRGGADGIISVMAHRDDPQGKVGDRSITLAKSRTGKEGHISGFDLIHVHLDFDEEGEPYGDAVAVPNSKPASSVKRRKEPPSSIDLRAAFAAASKEEGSIQPQLTGSCHCRAVPAIAVRMEFAKLRRKHGTDEKRSADAARKSFDDALRRLSEEFARAEDGHGVTWMWRRADGDLEMLEISDKFPTPLSDAAGGNGRAP